QGNIFRLERDRGDDRWRWRRWRGCRFSTTASRQYQAAESQTGNRGARPEVSCTHEKILEMKKACWQPMTKAHQKHALWKLGETGKIKNERSFSLGARINDRSLLFKRKFGFLSQIQQSNGVFVTERGGPVPSGK